jgi:hypothetical protein
MSFDTGSGFFKIVLTSGCPEEDLLGDVRDEGALFLEKPFTVDALTRVVRDVLDG